MKISRKCYVIVIPSDTPDGNGRPIVMEGNLDLPLCEVMDRAELLKDRYGDALVVELPLNVTTEFQRVAGSTDKVLVPGGVS